MEWRSHVCARILLDLNLVEHGRRVQREDSLNDGGRQGKGLSFVEFVAGIEGETEGLSDGGGDASGAGDHVSPTFQIQVFFFSAAHPEVKCGLCPRLVLGGIQQVRRVNK